MVIGRGFMTLTALLVLISGVAALPPAAQAEEHPQITLELREASLNQALHLLFEDTGYSYALAPGVSSTVMTLSLNQVSFQQALRVILDLNDLTYRKDPGDVYYITPRLESDPDEPLPQPAASSPAGQESEHQVFFIGPGGRYQLQYLDCRDLAQWFGGTVAAGTPMIPMPLGAVSGASGIGGGGGGAGASGAGPGSSGLAGGSGPSGRGDSGPSGRGGGAPGGGGGTRGSGTGGGRSGTGGRGRS